MKQPATLGWVGLIALGIGVWWVVRGAVHGDFGAFSPWILLAFFAALAYLWARKKSLKRK